jgi:hypothetical protein
MSRKSADTQLHSNIRKLIKPKFEMVAISEQPDQLVSTTSTPEVFRPKPVPTPKTFCRGIDSPNS